MAPPSTDVDVDIRQVGRLGRITLNRPRTINALTLGMVRAIHDALERFAAADEITTVLIDGAGDRGLCAGGDMRAVYDAIRANEPTAREFFREEYRMNARLARFAKPIVAFMDGIVMGGGVGVSAHASIRIVTERSVVAMPELDLGFFTDVGATWLLSRAPGELGTHAALTSARLGAADAIACGLADFSVPSETLADLVEAFAERDPRTVVGAISREVGDPASSALLAHAEWIDACYAAGSVEEVLDRLHRSPSDAAHRAAAEIATKSPTSTKVTFRALREARSLPSLEACLDAEFRLACTFLETADLLEGIRAVLIDKDRQPHWQPPTLRAITDDTVKAFFAHRADELHLAG